MSKDKSTLLDWLGLRREPDYSSARWLGGLISVVAIILLVLFLGGAIVAFLKAVFGGDPQGVALRNTGLVLAALLGAPFLVWRSVVAQKQVDVAEQGQITDRINKAVEGLGAEKTTSKQRKDKKGNLTYGKTAEGKEDYAQPVIIEVTEPNLEVRIGAIYALERIAQDSDRDHIQIMEILCAYIRQNAPGDPTREFPQDWQDAFAADRDAPDVERPGFSEIERWARELEKPREDIQVALTVIGRRKPAQIALEGHKDKESGWRGYRLDLRGASLQGADMAGMDFDNARFDRAELQGAVLSRAKLQGAVLIGAEMQGADLDKAEMQGAVLIWAKLQGAVLSEAEMQGADLCGAKLQRANLSGAKLQRAGLSEAKLQGAVLRVAEMQGANLSGAEMDSDTSLADTALQAAALREADYTDVSISQTQVDDVFYDGSVTFAPDISRAPGREAVLNWLEFEKQWRAWQKTIGYVPD